MDLSLIETHLSNLADTWNGWGKIFEASSEFTPIDGLGVSANLGDAFDGGIFNLVTGSIQNIFGEVK